MAARCKFSFGQISVAKWLTERKDRLVCVISILYHVIAVVYFIDLLVYLSIYLEMIQNKRSSTRDLINHQ